MKQTFRESFLTVSIGVTAAFVFWVLIFGLKLGNFWLNMTIATSTLAIWSILWHPAVFTSTLRFSRILLWGITSAVVLYFIFLIGDYFSGILPFQNDNVMSIYSNRSQAPRWLIAVLLMIIIGPGEEIFWRGFVQYRFAEKWGDAKGFWLVAALYSLVHVISLNLILIGAAAVCGLFWGALYRRTGSVLPGIVSHAVWDVTIFILLPLRS